MLSDARCRCAQANRRDVWAKGGKPISIAGKKSLCKPKSAGAQPIALLQLDFHVDASGQVELHQRVHGLVGGVDDIHQSLVCSDLELVA